MGQKCALLIANSIYEDTAFKPLVAPREDVERLAKVLKDQKVGGFDDVSVLIDQPVGAILKQIESFFQRKGVDLLLLYFSGHGLTNEWGHFYIIGRDSEKELLASTAISDEFIIRLMKYNYSPQILILDCCYSGAFGQGAKGEPQSSEHVANHLGEKIGKGKVILTATGAEQEAWEEILKDRKERMSYFTRYLVQGLETGEADGDNDGFVSIDELYDYVQKSLHKVKPNQTPSRSYDKVQGRIILAKNPNRTLYKKSLSAGSVPDLSAYRVYCIGQPGTGKTVFLSSMFHYLSIQKADTNFFLETNPESQRKLNNIYRELTQPSRNWPVATSMVYEWPFTYNVQLDLKVYPILQMTCVNDYDIFDGINLKRIDALLAFLDGHKLLTFMRGELGDRHDFFIEELRRTISLANLIQPCHFVITKWDLLESRYSLSDVRNRLMEVDAFKSFLENRNFRRVRPRSRLIPVSAVGMKFAELQPDGSMRKINGGSPHPFQVHIPLAYILYDELKARKSKASHQAQDLHPVRQTTLAPMKVVHDFIEHLEFLIHTFELRFPESDLSGIDKL